MHSQRQELWHGVGLTASGKWEGLGVALKLMGNESRMCNYTVAVRAATGREEGAVVP